MKTFTFFCVALVAFLASTVSATLNVDTPIAGIPYYLTPSTRSPGPFSNDGSSTLFISGSCSVDRGNNPCTIPVVKLDSTAPYRQLDEVHRMLTDRCTLESMTLGAAGQGTVQLPPGLQLTGLQGDTGIIRGNAVLCGLMQYNASVTTILAGLVSAHVASSTQGALDYLTNTLNNMTAVGRRLRVL